MCMRERKFRHRGGVSLHRSAPEKSNVYLERFLRSFLEKLIDFSKAEFKQKFVLEDTYSSL